ncbi:MAG: metallophosphoesterase [Bacteroidota bacterium]
MCPKAAFAFLLLVLTSFFGFGQTKQSKTTKELINSLNDGPYVFIEGDQLIEKNIVNGKVISKTLPTDTYPKKFERAKSRYKKVKRIAALSDIHGQHDLAVEILTNHQIIDAQQNWTYGEGHLIIVGDIFDRGPKVNETLWLLFKLEKQAEKASGKVHVLLGNHEYLVFQHDLRYIHKKYRIASALLKTGYVDLYGKNTVMGRWLRSKPTIAKINDITFVHGGFSKEFLASGYNRKDINRVMGESIDVAPAQLDSTGISYRYFGPASPVWYRGYFYDDLPEEEISDILSATFSKRIVVGHCSNETVVELYDGKIYGVDSSIKLGAYGELLLIEGKDYYRGTKSGERVRF